MKCVFILKTVKVKSQPSASITFLFLICSNSDHARVPVPGGFLQVGLQGQNYYGNNVTIRTAYLPSGAQKSWIDYETVLPAGSLEYFYIYVHNVTSPNPPVNSEFIRLQIWRPRDLTQYQYELVWERRVEVSYNLPIGALYTVSIFVYIHVYQ